jgi:hypothetical protein
MVDIKEIDMKKFFFGVVAAAIVFLVLFFAVINRQFFAGVTLGPGVERSQEVTAVVPKVVGTHVSGSVGVTEVAVESEVQVVERV